MGKPRKKRGLSQPALHCFCTAVDGSGLGQESATRPKVCKTKGVHPSATQGMNALAKTNFRLLCCPLLPHERNAVFQEGASRKRERLRRRLEIQADMLSTTLHPTEQEDFTQCCWRNGLAIGRNGESGDASH